MNARVSIRRLGANVATVASFAAGVSICATTVDAAAPESVLQGVFTEEQAERGEESYQSICAACHGEQLRASDPNAPDLRDMFFTINWVGQSVGDKFDRIHTTMPPGAGGTLQRDMVVDIVAFILSFNGVPAGDEELPADREYLDQIAIETAP